MFKSTFIAALVAAASASRTSEQPVEDNFNIMEESWSDFCLGIAPHKFAAMFEAADADASGFLTFDEVKAAIDASPDIDTQEKNFVNGLLVKAFKVADMKKFSGGDEKDGEISRDEFLNFFTSCLAGEPKAYWAFAFLDAAMQDGNDGWSIPDYQVAAAMHHHFGFVRNEMMLTFINHEKRAEFDDGVLPFWVVWQSLNAANGTWTHPGPKVFDIESQDWSEYCTEEGQQAVEQMHTAGDANQDGFIDFSEVMDFIALEFNEDYELAFFEKHDRILQLASGSDQLLTQSEFQDFFSCAHGQPKIYWAYVWLAGAAAWGGEGHLTMPDENVAYFLAEEFGASMDEVLPIVNSVQGEGTRDSNNRDELWFWAVYKKSLEYQ